MKRIDARWMAFLTLILVVGLTACAPKAGEISPAKQMTAQQPTDASANHVSSPTQAAAKSADATIPCDQLIPPDEARTLMTGLSPELIEQHGQGKTTCIWQYTSKVTRQAAEFRLEAGFGGSAVEDWTAARKLELAGQPPDLNVISIDGLGDENYTWTVKPDNQSKVYVRRGSQTLVMHYHAADILFMATESGMIDMTDRIFGRMNP